MAGFRAVVMGPRSSSPLLRSRRDAPASLPSGGPCRKDAFASGRSRPNPRVLTSLPGIKHQIESFFLVRFTILICWVYTVNIPRLPLLALLSPARPRRPLMTAEHVRLEAARQQSAPWKQWGPYLSERQWG